MVWLSEIYANIADFIDLGGNVLYAIMFAAGVAGNVAVCLVVAKNRFEIFKRFLK